MCNNSIRQWVRNVACFFAIVLMIPSLAQAAYYKPIDVYPNQGGYAGFGYGPLSNGQYHNGTDFSATEGSKVYALKDGYVIYSKEGQGFGGLGTTDAKGGVIVIRHQDNSGNYFYAVYGHLNRNLQDNTTEFVQAGTVIGTVRSFYWDGKYWPHLHLGIYYGSPFPSSGWGWSVSLANWYDPVYALNSWSGPVTSSKLTVYDFWKKADPLYADPLSTVWHPNFDAQYKVKNDGTQAITIKQFALSIHDSSNKFLFDMKNPSTGQSRFYNNITLYPGQFQYFDFSVAYFTTEGNYKVVAKAQMPDGTWNEMASQDFTILAKPVTIMNGTHTLSWAYFTGDNSRWYISPTSGAGNVYSLTAIKNHNAGWATVGEDVASIDLKNNLVSIDGNLDSDSSDRYYDIGWNEWVQNASIHHDRQWIQGKTVSIKWYFFYVAGTGRWYIINVPGYGSGTSVLMFSEKDGQYDWIKTDTANLKPVFFIENGTLYLKFGN